MNAFLNTPLDYVKGAGSIKAGLLAAELHLRTVGDILEYYPFRYVDRSQVISIAELLAAGDFVQSKGVLGAIAIEGEGNKKRMRSSIADGSGRVELIWFKGVKWLQDHLKKGQEYMVYGKVSDFKGHKNIAHPELELIGDEPQKGGFLQPIYSTTEKLTKRGLNSKGIEKIISNLVRQPELNIEETLPDYLLERFKLMPKRQAVINIHSPKTTDDAELARRRLKFEELFYIQLELLLKKELRTKAIKGFVFDSIGENFNTFYEHHLPFELTGAQKRVLREVRRDLKSGVQMNRLLQGDVGSGKTIVAALAALIAIDNGYQATIMAPTEILANQHYDGLSELLAPWGLRSPCSQGRARLPAGAI